MSAAALSVPTIAVQLRGPLRLALARRGVRGSELDDLSQEVLLVLHRRNVALPDERAARAWLHEAARRVASNARRSQQRAERRSTVEPEVTSFPCPDAWVEHCEIQAVLDGFLAELPADRRRVFELSELEGLSAPEIAGRTGMNVNTTSSWIRRLRQRWAARGAMLLLLALAVMLGALGSTCAARSRSPSVVQTRAPAGWPDDHRPPVLVAAGLAR
jgi:RNA polymerase sigma factor (sigma-70 family)